MSRAKDLWTDQYDTAVIRFVTDEDDRETLERNLRKLGFSSHDIRHEIDNAISERAELAAYEAAIAYYERIRS